MLKTLVVAVVCSWLVAGCGGKPDGAPTAPAEDFGVQRQADSLDAKLTSGGASVHLTVVTSAPQVIDVTYDFGSPVVAFHIDYAQGTGEFMPAGGALDAAQSRLMEQLLAHFQDTLPTDESARSLVENTALRETMLMQIVPVGESLQSYGFVAERGWTYIGCGCSNQYDGHGAYRTGGKGCGCTGGSGNGCKGRCGGGCMQDGASINAYTQDCLCHDYGLCSWTTAADDFAFAASNCGATTGCY